MARMGGSTTVADRDREREAGARIREQEKEDRFRNNIQHPFSISIFYKTLSNNIL